MYRLYYTRTIPDQTDLEDEGNCSCTCCAYCAYYAYSGCTYHEYTPHQVDLKVEVDPNSAYRANNGAEINGFGKDGFGNFGEINLGGRSAYDFPVANATHPNSPLPPTLL